MSEEIASMTKDKFWSQLVAADNAREAQELRDFRRYQNGDFDSEAILAAQDCEKVYEQEQLEQCAERLHKMVQRAPLRREIYRKILVLCKEQKPIEFVEESVAHYAELRLAAQNPRQLIETLVLHGGLRKIGVSQSGEVLPDSCPESIPEDAFDDMLAYYAVETTEAGNIVCERMDPQALMRKLLDKIPARAQTYIEVLDYCKTPRSYEEIASLLKGRDVLKISIHPSDKQAIQPSVFLDKLERAGSLVWDDGWKLTREGELFLKSANI